MAPTERLPAHRIALRALLLGITGGLVAGAWYAISNFVSHRAAPPPFAVLWWLVSGAAWWAALCAGVAIFEGLLRDAPGPGRWAVFVALTAPLALVGDVAWRWGSELAFDGALPDPLSVVGKAFDAWGWRRSLVVAPLILTGATRAAGSVPPRQAVVLAVAAALCLAIRGPDSEGTYLHPWSFDNHLLRPLAALAGMWLGDALWERLAARLDRQSP